MQQTERKSLFDLGQLVATPRALAALEKAGQNAMDFLSRHVTGDWGELREDDRKENALSVKRGFRSRFVVIHQVAANGACGDTVDARAFLRITD